MTKHSIYRASFRRQIANTDTTATPDDAFPKDRCEDRRPVTMPAYAMLEDQSTFSVTVIDLSYDGCMVETSVALLPGLHLKLSVLSFGALNAFVRWYANGKAGLSFNADVSPPKAHKPRHHQRVSLVADVFLRRTGRTNYFTRISDASPTGCKVEFVERPAIGERVWVKFDGLDALQAEVRWVNGFIGGVQFFRPVYPAVFDLLLVRLR